MTTPTPPPIQPPRSSRPAEQKESFQPPLPWLSVPEEPFPPRASYKRRRRRREPVSGDEKDFSAPAGIRDGEGAEKAPEETTDNVAVKDEKKEDNAEAAVSEEADVASQASTAVAGSEANTPATSHAPSEDGSVHPRTRPAQPTPRTSTASHARNPTIPAVPLLPIKPIRPGSVTSTTQKSAKTAADKLEPSKADAPAAEIPKAEGAAEEAPKPEPPAKPVAKSWADLVRSKAAPAPAPSPATNGIVAAAGPAPSKSNSLSDALASFSVNAEKRVSFLEPRGLVNSGNLCYMNSVSPHMPQFSSRY
jgi:ubiquitin carboxyl-terminal hydrolase 10